MKRIALASRPVRPVAGAIQRRAPRRLFASIPSKNPVPPKPIEPFNEQAIPLGPYYETILNNPQPIPREKPEEAPTSSTDNESPPSSPPSKQPRNRKSKDEKAATATSLSQPTTTPTPTPPPSSAADQARVIFGSRLAGPAERAERLAAIRTNSALVAGVLVPPRPEEPDNCCMSGCVNCVWDRYRDEMEMWASASAEAERRLRAQEAGMAAGMVESAAAASPWSPTASTSARSAGPQSMDDDGWGSEATWDVSSENRSGAKIAKDLWDEDLYRNVPVGIREFMKIEKRLKEKHVRDGTMGG